MSVSSSCCCEIYVCLHLRNLSIIAGGKVVIIGGGFYKHKLDTPTPKYVWTFAAIKFNNFNSLIAFHGYVTLLASTVYFELPPSVLCTMMENDWQWERNKEDADR